MNIVPIIIGALLALIVPLLHIRKIFHEEEKQYLNMLKKNQKRAYYIALVGALLLSYILMFSLITLMLNGLYMIVSDPKDAFSTIAIMIIPFLIIATIGIVTFYVPFKYTVPEGYVYNHQLANIILLMMGIVSLFIVGALSYFLFLGLEQLIGFSRDEGGFVEILENKSFHPVKTLFYSIFISPALLLTGGVLGLFSRRKRRSY